MRIKTSELTGAALDLSVAKALKLYLRHQKRIGCRAAGYHAVGKAYGYIWYDTQPDGYVGSIYGWNPSRCWKDGGPLIDKYHVQTSYNGNGFSQSPSGEYWCAYVCEDSGREIRPSGSGPTALIATCRAIVAAELGEYVDVPDELCE